MDLVVRPCGRVEAVYDEAVDLSLIGRPVITRASRVEPDAGGRWTADLDPVGGPALGPFRLRSEALRAEADWLRENWLSRPA